MENRGREEQEIPLLLCHCLVKSLLYVDRASPFVGPSKQVPLKIKINHSIIVYKSPKTSEEEANPHPPIFSNWSRIALKSPTHSQGSSKELPDKFIFSHN